MSLALIAGEGDLPGILIRHLEEKGRPFRLCELEGFPCPARGDRPTIRFRIETLGTLIAELKQLGVMEVCLAGSVARPKIDPSAIDRATIPLVPRLMSALQSGDDAALRSVLSFFEEVGITPVAAHEIVPDLFPAPGVQGTVAPTDQDRRDTERGIEIIAAMGQVDLGQACIVSRGQALVVEALGGTDWMMRSLLVPADSLGSRLVGDETSWDDPIGKAADWLTGAGQNPGPLKRDPKLPQGGVLVKAAKPGQDRRADMPTVGPRTFWRAREIAINGIVIEAGNVMVLDHARCVEIANDAGLFFWVKE